MPTPGDFMQRSHHTSPPRHHAAAVPTLLAAHADGVRLRLRWMPGGLRRLRGRVGRLRQQGEKVDKDEFLADFKDGLEASTTAAITMTMEPRGRTAA